MNAKTTLSQNTEDTQHEYFLVDSNHSYRN